MKKELRYDNRFGFAKYAKAYWIFTENRVGEQFVFSFPKGVTVSVIRSCSWDYEGVKMGFAMDSSYGFIAGLYEALVWDRYGKPIGEAQCLDHTQVHSLLSRCQSKWG